MGTERVRMLCAEVDWGAVGHAYGFATEIPFALEELAAAGADAARGMLVLGGFWGNVFHEGSRYDASLATLPILVEIARDPTCAVRTNVLDLVVALLLGNEESFVDTGYEPSQSSPDPRLLERLQRAFDDCSGAFVELLHDHDAHVRASAARCLAWVREPAGPARAELEARFAVDRDPDVRATILYALSLLGTDALAVAAAGDADVVVRVHAALAIVRLRGVAAAPDSTAVVRAATSVKGRSAVPFLRGELAVLAHHLAGESDVAPQPSVARELEETLRRRAPPLPIEPTKTPKASSSESRRTEPSGTFPSDLSPFPRRGLNADERVRFVSMNGNAIRVAGDFAQIGDITGTGAVLSVEGARVERLPWPALRGGWTTAVVDDGEGGFVFGGQWTQTGGRTVGGIVRFHRDGSPYDRWDRWGGIRCTGLARHGKTLFAIEQGGPRGPAPKLLGIDMDSLDTVWLPSFQGAVTALALVDRTLFVGGRFGRVENAVRPGLAAFDVESRRLLDVTAPLLARVPHRIACTASTVYVGSRLQGPSPDGRTDALVAIDRETGAVVWESGLGADADVASLSIGGGRLYVAGRFAQVGGAARNGACAFDLADHRLLDWAPVDEAKPATVELVQHLDDDTVLLGGAFTPRGHRPTRGIVWVDARGSAKGIDVRVAGTLSEIAVDGTRIAVAGGFPIIGEARIDGAAEIDIGSGAATPWATPTVSVASAAEDERGVCTSSRDVVTEGGRDVTIAHRGNAGSWEVHVNERVSQIVLDETRAWIIGRFTRVGGQPRHYFACLSRATGEVLSPRADFDRPPAAIARLGEHVFVAGGFRHLGREPLAGVVRLTAHDGAIAPLPFSMSGSVRALATSDRQLAVLGCFGTNGGASSELVLLLEVATAAATEIPLALRALNGPGRLTHAAFRSGHLVVAGDFTVINGHPRSGLAELALDGRVSDWAPRLALRRATPIVEVMATSDARVAIGGSLSIIVQGVADAIDLAVFEA